MLHIILCMACIHHKTFVLFRPQIGRARTAALQSLDTLDKHRGYMRSLMRGRYRHTGHAFVTFNKASVAREVLRKLSKGGTDELRFESILVRNAPLGSRHPTFK